MIAERGGFAACQFAVAQHFRGEVDYDVVHKDYSRKRHADGQPHDHRHEPARQPFITKRATFGAPDMARVSTSHMERQNLTTRTQIRRLTRPCNGFSKKLENYRPAIALHFAFYNFCRIHEALRVTPAMQAGITYHVWSIEELDPSRTGADGCTWSPNASPGAC